MPSETVVDENQEAKDFDISCRPIDLSRDAFISKKLLSEQGSIDHQNEFCNANELARIRHGFDCWLNAFHKKRPQHDVIWRVGKSIVISLSHSPPLCYERSLHIYIYQITIVEFGVLLYLRLLLFFKNILDLA